MSDWEDIVYHVSVEVPEIDGRISPIVLPSSPQFPAITGQLVSEPQDPTQDGPALVEPRWRFKVWTATHAELDPVVRSLKAAFNVRRDGPFQVSLVEGGFQDRDQKTGRWWQVVDVLGWQSEPEPAS